LLGLIWIVGSGEATTPPQQASTYMLSGTTHININEQPEEAGAVEETEDSKETLFKEIKKFNQTVYDIKNRYMEDVDTRDLINAGIRGMLDELDRFSVLMERQSYDRLMESTSGKYEGLGIEIDARDHYIIVVTPFEGSPAYKKGLHSGDRIEKIEGQSTYDMTTSDASKLMRGSAGTSINISIRRQGIPDLLDFDIERAVIELKSVNYYGVVDDSDIGYIRLSRFAEETSAELTEAVQEMKDRKVKGLIFDLRSNGGGLLQQAVETAELFIDEGRLVVYTKGKNPNSERRHYSRRLPLMPDVPMVVLVDEGTASASEIVSGALQDWDRAVIMGQQTYGKGLVQQIFTLGDGEDVNLKLTTAKYYVPSGRCIQRPERQNKPGHGEAMADLDADSASADTMSVEEKEIYYTNGGRIVYGGGGIAPDVELEAPAFLKPIEINLERKSLFFDFAVKYVSEHSDLPLDFEVTDDILAEFRDFIKEKDFSYKTAMEVSLDEMKKVADEENKTELFAQHMKELEDQIEHEKEADFKNSAPYIKKSIKREIVANIAGQRGVYEEVILKTDPAVKSAVELLNDPNEYGNVLSSQSTTGQKPGDEE
jgi:carboxyl-terminal processing protease